MNHKIMNQLMATFGLIFSIFTMNISVHGYGQGKVIRWEYEVKRVELNCPARWFFCRFVGSSCRKCDQFLKKQRNNFDAQIKFLV